MITARSALVSQTAEYALRAVVYMASAPERSLTAQQIAQATGVPTGYLAKVLQGLGRAGLLHSQRGLGGGFVLARSPSSMSMWDVVQAIDPIRRIDHCPGRLESHRFGLCALHRQLDDALAGIQRTFTTCKISRLIDRVHRA
jgi:Rrf2 family protein